MWVPWRILNGTLGRTCVRDSDDRDMSEEEDFVDSDDGSVADLDRDMSDEEDCCDSDVGSVADLEWDTWADACTCGGRVCYQCYKLRIRGLL